MRCPKCNRENEAKNRFCIFCGTILQEPEVEPVSEPEAIQSEESTSLISKLQQEVRRLNTLVSLMNERLAVLERRQGLIAPSAERIEAIEPETTPVPQVTEELEFEEIPVSPLVGVTPEEKAVPVVEQWQSPVTEPPISPPKQPRSPGAVEREWEQILGGNWLARIGVLAIIIGAGFFLKFAFDKNWIGPAGRVIIGAVIGLFMLGGGHYWQKKYPIFANAISGGGIAVLYLSVFAAYSFYDLIGFYPAIVLLLIVSIISAVLALRYNAMALAILGIIGAFLAPFILTITESTSTGVTQHANSVWLLVYIIVVDVGVLWLSTFRNWRWFTLISLIGSLSVYGVWYGRFGDEVSLLASIGCLTVIFLIFVSATMLYHIIWRKVSEAFDYSLMVLNAIAYFSISYSLLWDDFKGWLGGFSLLLSLFYGGLAYVARKRGTENTRLALFAFGIALLFFTIAIPSQLERMTWTTIAWSVQGTILVWLSFKAGIPFLRISGYFVFGIVAFTLLLFEIITDLGTLSLIFNERFLTFVVSIICIYFTGYLLWKRSDPSQEKNFEYVYPVFLVAGNIFSMWIMAVEVTSFKPSIHEAWPLIFLVAIAGLITLYHVIWRRIPKTFDEVLIVLNVIFYIAISIIVWGDLETWMGSLYFMLSIFFGYLTYICIMRGADYVRLNYFTFGATFLLLSIAIPAQFKDTAWTTIGWCIEGVLLVWLSYKLGMLQFRISSYLVFIAIVFRLLFFDAIVNIRTFTPIINERFLAFIISIAAMYLVSYLHWRGRENLTERERDLYLTYPAFLVAANFFTIYLFSAEIWGAFSKQIANLSAAESVGAAGDSLRSARNLSLTGLWAVYAVILLVTGIVKRWRPVRVAGLGLICIPIVKVFVYDVFALEQLYRIIAFIGLGILLITSGYLYQRYRDVIKDFVVKK